MRLKLTSCLIAETRWGIRKAFSWFQYNNCLLHATDNLHYFSVRRNIQLPGNVMNLQVCFSRGKILFFCIADNPSWDFSRNKTLGFGRISVIFVVLVCQVFNT